MTDQTSAAERPDDALANAVGVVERALANPSLQPQIESFFDPATSTITHLVRDPGSGTCALVDGVLDFDAASGRTSTAAADRVVARVAALGLRAEWLLETHVHADHLSAAPHLQRRLGGRIAIGAGVVAVQETFGRLFNAGPELARDGSQFDRLFVDGDRFAVGALEGLALHVPGHTPACLAYVIGDAVFPGDTLFMPDYGTARCDFPGGDAAALYRSMRRLLRLPSATRMFLCHDYKAPGRDAYAWETTVGAQQQNVHLRDADEAAFVGMRRARDATLPVPKLLLPSVQVNMRAGRLPEPEANGIRYLKLPLDAL
jgi:glyoxylase-like metal-dependent hydrolase (beta-lactamase superfamily II)